MGYKVSAINLWDTQVRPYKKYSPNEHTVAYYPLEEDVNDYSGNANHGSWNPNSFDWWVANYSGNSTTLPYSIINRNIYTVNVWAYANSTETTWNRRFLWQHTSSSRWFNLGYIKNSWILYQTWPNSNTMTYVDYADSSIQWWHLITWVTDWTNMYLYVDWELKDTDTYTWNNWQTLYMWYDHWYNWYAWNWKLSELIVEDIAWEPRKIEKYYNDTKENYLWGWWKPWANTISYYKFDWNLNDSSWNNRNLSWGSSWTFWTTAWWWTYAIFNQSWYTNKLYDIPFNSQSYTVSIWYNYNQATSSSSRIAMDFSDWSIYTPRIRQETDWKTYIWISWNDLDYILNSIWVWHNIVITYSANSISLYIDWSKVKSWTSSSVNKTISLVLGRDYNQTWTTYTSRNYLGEMILESICWTSLDVANYYNQTKSNYWL